VTHFALPVFWRRYRALPKTVRRLADKNFKLLKEDSRRRSLHFKKVGGKKHLWSARVGDQHRALGLDKPEGVFWFWIGSHSEYDAILAKSC
jgi:hypothetical protein